MHVFSVMKIRHSWFEVKVFQQYIDVTSSDMMMGYLWMLFLFQVSAKLYEILVDLMTKTLDKAAVLIYSYFSIFHQHSNKKFSP